MSDGMKPAIFRRQHWNEREAPLTPELMEVRRYLQAIAEATKPKRHLKTTYLCMPTSVDE